MTQEKANAVNRAHFNPASVLATKANERARIASRISSNRQRAKTSANLPTQQRPKSISGPPAAFVRRSTLRELEWAMLFSKILKVLAFMQIFHRIREASRRPADSKLGGSAFRAEFPVDLSYDSDSPGDSPQACGYTKSNFKPMIEMAV